MPGLPIDAAPAFDVIGYELALAPDFAHRSLTGRETIRLRSLKDGLTTLTFSGNALSVEAEGAQVRPADGRLLIDLAKPLRKGQTFSLRLTYKGTPARGLVWGARSVYSGYFTCDWMVCDQDRPGDLAGLKLSLTLPPGLK